MSLKDKTDQFYRLRISAADGSYPAQGGASRARSRISLLFDEGTFIETQALCSRHLPGLPAEDTFGESVVTGYGLVGGRPVFAYIQDGGVRGGGVSFAHAKKISDLIDMAVKAGAPIVAVFDSDGLVLTEDTDALAAFGEVLAKINNASGVVPQLALVLGACVGGAAVLAASCDIVIFSSKGGRACTTPPLVLKAVTGEDVDAGAESASRKGFAHIVMPDEAACADAARQILSMLPANNLDPAPCARSGDPAERENSELFDIVAEAGGAYDMAGVINSIVDSGSFIEFQAGYAESMITGLARLDGMPVGLVANQPLLGGGLLNLAACSKAARFVRFCDSFNIPVITLVDTAGFEISAAEEKNAGMLAAARLAHAYCEATCPKITLVAGRAFGSAYLAMCSKSTGADLALAWPGALISPLAPEAAATVLYSDRIAAAEDAIAERARAIAEYADTKASVYEAAKKGHIDAIIDPAHTRLELSRALDMLSSKSERKLPKKHGNMAL